MHLPFINSRCSREEEERRAVGGGPAGRLNGDPPLLLVTLEDGVAQDDRVMPVREGRVRRRRGQVARVNVLVEGAEAVLEGVREALVVAAGVGTVAPRQVG